MKTKHTVTLLAALLLVPLAAFAAGPTRFKTDYLENPLGLDTTKPRFSWILEDPAPGAKQTAYQVQAASSPEKLARGEADLWDSGRVESAQSHLVKYDGKTLVSRQRVWWRVKSWGKDGKETGWSEAVSRSVCWSRRIGAHSGSKRRKLPRRTMMRPAYGFA